MWGFIVISTLSQSSYIYLKTDFLTRRGVSRLGFETLALMYSLPYALLVWGWVHPFTLSQPRQIPYSRTSMIFFLLSFSWMCCTTNNVPTYVLVAFAWMWLMASVVWCVSASFERQPYYHLLPIRMWYALRNKLRRLMGTGGVSPSFYGDLWNGCICVHFILW